MTFIIAIIIFFLGLIIFSFTGSNIILILFFGIPFTKKLEKIDLLKSNNPIISRYIVSLFIQIIILFVSATILYIFFPDSYFISLMVGYIFGLFGIISKINQFGLNKNNFSDYFEVNEKYFSEESIELYNSGVLFGFIISKSKEIK